jgi:hypothetical protein
VEDRCIGSVNVPQAKKLFSMHLMEFLADEAHVEAHFGPFGDRANLDARYVTVYAKHTIGSELVLDAPNGTLR